MTLPNDSGLATGFPFADAALPSPETPCMNGIFSPVGGTLLVCAIAAIAMAAVLFVRRGAVSTARREGSAREKLKDERADAETDVASE